MSLILKKISKHLNIRFPIAKFSKDLGYSKGAISEFYNDKKELSENFKEKFEEFYNIKFSDFIDNENQNTLEEPTITYNLNKSTLKDRFRSVLDELGYNPSSFASKLGDRAEKYYKILDGRSKTMHPSTYNKIKEIFPSIDVDWLNTGKGNKNIKSEFWKPKEIIVAPPEEFIERMNNLEEKIDSLFKLDKLKVDSLLRNKEQIVELTKEIERLKRLNVRQSS